MKMDKKIKYKGEAYFQVGCRKCDTGNWKILSDGVSFIVKCIKCGHISEIPVKLKTKPDSYLKINNYDVLNNEKGGKKL